MTVHVSSKPADGASRLPTAAWLVLGPESTDQDIASLRRILAETYLEMGILHAAARQFAKAVREHEIAFGYDHPQTKEARKLADMVRVQMTST
jgi:hypothetical protein